MEILFKTIAGSRLYNMHHDNSDYDYYTVVSTVRTGKAKYSTHKIIDDTDSVVVDFGTWMKYCQNGVPQALEAMYSQKPIIDKIGPFRAGFTVGSAGWPRYLRTIKSFALNEDNAFKQKRHSLRLACNFQDLRRYGKFNPSLIEEDVEAINEYAKRYSGEELYNWALGIAWYDGT